MLNNKITESKTFCPAPWTTIRIGTNGSIGICPYSKDIGNYLNQDIPSILKNDLIGSIKNSIKNNEWHNHCEYCRDTEQHGGRSERLLYIDSIAADYKKFIELHPDDNILIDCSLNWNNLCNLTCVYCNEDSSSSWQSFKKIPLNISKLDENSVIEFLINNQNYLQNIMIGGGEPLLQKTIHNLLDKIERPVHIHLTTNLSVPLTNNPTYLSIINNKNLFVNWMISFDGIKEKFEYVRHGALWDVFYKNIEILKSTNQKIIAHPVYCLYSAFDLEEYYNFCVEENLDIFWCDLSSPCELDIRFAPTKLREEAIKNIDFIINKYSSKTNLSISTLTQYREMAINGVPIFDSYITKDFNDHQRSNQILKFHDRVEKLLSKRLQFRDVWPNVANILQEYV